MSSRSPFVRRFVRQRVAAVASLAAAVLGTAGCAVDAEVTPEMADRWDGRTLHDIDAETLSGESASLSQWRGQVLLVVNTASECGLTPQYESLQELHDRYAGQGFAVLGFPSRSFNQELDSNDAIRAFCDDRFSITFPMFAPVAVKEDDPDRAAVFEFLATETGQAPGWNFGKYLVGRDGRAIEFFGPMVKPGSDDVVAAIETALEAGTDATG